MINVSIYSLLDVLVAVPRRDTTPEYLSLIRRTITLPSASIPRSWCTYISICAYQHVHNPWYDRRRRQSGSLMRTGLTTAHNPGGCGGGIANRNTGWCICPPDPHGMEGYKKIRSQKDCILPRPYLPQDKIMNRTLRQLGFSGNG